MVNAHRETLTSPQGPLQREREKAAEAGLGEMTQNQCLGPVYTYLSPHSASRQAGRGGSRESGFLPSYFGSQVVAALATGRCRPSIRARGWEEGRESWRLRQVMGPEPQRQPGPALGLCVEPKWLRSRVTVTG